MKKNIVYLTGLIGCILLAGAESVYAKETTYSCPDSTALKIEEVSKGSDEWAYTGNLVGGDSPALKTGKSTKKYLPTVKRFAQARLDAKGQGNKPVFFCLYRGKIPDMDEDGDWAVTAHVDFPSNTTCKMGGPLNEKGHCIDKDPTKCPLTCSN